MFWSGLRAGQGPTPSRARMSASRKRPASTSRALSISTPSSATVRLSGGMEPGVVPPTSAWWPRAATNQAGAASPSANTGMTTVMSGRWVPPL